MGQAISSRLEMRDPTRCEDMVGSQRHQGSRVLKDYSTPTIVAPGSSGSFTQTRTCVCFGHGDLEKSRTCYRAHNNPVIGRGERSFVCGAHSGINLASPPELNLGLAIAL